MENKEGVLIIKNLKSLTIIIVVLIVMFMLVSRPPSKVHYRNREYKQPVVYNVQTFKDKFNGDYEPIGVKVDGMDVLDKVANSKQDESLAPTRLVLKKSKNKIVIYDLSGGP